MLKKNGTLTPVSWEEAIGEMVHRFREIQQKHGKDAIAWLGTGQIPFERTGVFGRFGQVWHGHLARRWQHPSVHGDGCSRL